MAILLKENAMVCIHIGCEVLFEGPSLRCPLCGWQGVLYTEVEELAAAQTGRMIGPSVSLGSRLQ